MCRELQTANLHSGFTMIWWSNGSSHHVRSRSDGLSRFRASSSLNQFWRDWNVGNKGQECGNKGHFLQGQTHSHPYSSLKVDSPSGPTTHQVSVSIARQCCLDIVLQFADKLIILLGRPMQFCYLQWRHSHKWIESPLRLRNSIKYYAIFYKFI